MREFRVPITQFKSDADALQILFYPTRSLIEPGVSFEPLSKGAGSVAVDRFLVTVPTPTDKWGDVPADVTREIVVYYQGEPLRLARVAWVTPGDELLNMDTLLQQWISCRRKQCVDKPDASFFLDVDLQSLPVLIAHDPVKAKEFRWLQERLMAHLDWRLGGVNLPQTEPALVRPLREVERFMQKAFDCHFKGNPVAEEKACEEFAAGQLRHACKYSDADGYEYHAGDADSAFIFLFAELALALVKLGGDVGDRWRPRVSMMARMQPIFLTRWTESGNDPRCFRRYDGTAKPLGTYPPALVEELREYGRHRNDLCELQKLMRRQLQRTTNCHNAFGMSQRC